MPSALMAAVSGPCGVLQSDKVSGWLEALGTIGAFAVALLLAWFALRDRREQQARSVVAYASGGPIKYPQPGMTKSIGSDNCQFDAGVLLPVGLTSGTVTFAVPTSEFAWTLQNRSQEMISDVHAQLVDPQGDVLYDMGTTPVVWPGWDQEHRIFTPAEGSRIGGQLRVRITFRDAVGREWTRTSGERLRRAGRRRR